MKRALFTGITGHDGSYLAELLLANGYEVWGVIRSSSSFNAGRIDHLYQDIHAGGPLRLVYGDLNDASSMNRILREARPNQIYNLGAQSHVRVGFDIPEYTAEITALGTERLVDALRDVGIMPRVYQASSSGMFGATPAPQRERTPFHPRSPFACAKVYARYLTQNNREAYGIFAVNGIPFNHESPRRGPTFVTRKTTRAAAHIARGLEHKLYLGNLDAKRDWSFAGDYVLAMWMMLQADKPDDYVVATGEAHTVREVLDIAFGHVGLERNTYIEIDPRYFRPAEVDHLCGDASKARAVLGWRPTVTFRELIVMMVEADLDDRRLASSAPPRRTAT